MIVRLFVGAGLFALGYFVGKEMGRAEYIRDQLRWAREDGELIPTSRESTASADSLRTEPGVTDDVPLEQEGS